MKTHQEFRDTKIGKIPDEWEVVKLGDEEVTVLIMGQSPPSSTYNNAGIGLPFLQGNAEFGEMYPIPVLSCSHPIKITEKNDILLSVRAPVGDVNIAPFKSCIGRGLAAIRPKGDKLDYLFLFYYLELGSRLFESLSMGSTFKAIRKMEIEKFRVLLPPLPEQKKIAEILSTVDQAIEKADEAIAKTERVKKGLMQELLTKGIGHKSFKQTEIGKIPKEWDVVKVGEVAEIHDSKRIPLSEMERGKRKGSYPYCGANGIIDYIDDYIFNGEFVLLAEDGGDYNKFGNSAYIMKEKFWVNNHAHILKAMENEITNLFLYYVFNFFDLNYYIVGSTRKKLNQERMKKILIPRPILPEQKKITAILTTLDKRLQLLREKKGRLGRVKKGLMNDLLTGKRRVKLET